MNGPTLRTEALSKSFGGLHAVADVTIAFQLGEVHAIIGPNGAGKTTLINLLSGDLAPSAGRIFLDEREITGQPAYRISQLGVGRSYQRTNIFPELTCRRNCWLAAQSRLPSSMRFIKPAKRYGQIAARVEHALALAGLARRQGLTASTLSHGEQRQLEIAMLLATEPNILLLDEPMAGMGARESDALVGLIRRLAEDHTVVLIEHDMDAVFAVAETLTVMVDGRILESGSPEEIRRSEAVRSAYLGDEMIEADP